MTKWDCNYEKENNTKKAFFIINRANIDIDKYIESQNLIKLSSKNELEPNRYFNLSKDSLGDADLYHKENSSSGVTSAVLLDKTSGKLWVTIGFKD